MLRSSPRGVKIEDFYFFSSRGCEAVLVELKSEIFTPPPDKAVILNFSTNKKKVQCKKVQY